MYILIYLFVVMVILLLVTGTGLKDGQDRKQEKLLLYLPSIQTNHKSNKQFLSRNTNTLCHNQLTSVIYNSCCFCSIWWCLFWSEFVGKNSRSLQFSVRCWHQSFSVYHSVVLCADVSVKHSDGQISNRILHAKSQIFKRMILNHDI